MTGDECGHESSVEEIRSLRIAVYQFLLQEASMEDRGAVRMTGEHAAWMTGRGVWMMRKQCGCQ
jgi:hypothetical protein